MSDNFFDDIDELSIRPSRSNLFALSDYSPRNVEDEEEPGLLSNLGNLAWSGVKDAGANVLTGVEQAVGGKWDIDDSIRASADETYNKVDQGWRDDIARAGFQEESDNTVRGVTGAAIKSLGSMLAYAPAAALGPVGAAAYAGGLTGTMIGGGSYSDTKAALSQLSDEELSRSGAFGAYLEKARESTRGDEQAARALAKEAMIEDLSRQSFKQGATIGGVSGAALGPALGKIFKGGQGAVQGMKHGALTEGSQELIESGTETHAIESALAQVQGRETDWNRVGRGAAFGATLGAGIGGTVGGIAGAVTPRKDKGPSVDDVVQAGREAAREAGGDELSQAVAGSNGLVVGVAAAPSQAQVDALKNMSPFDFHPQQGLSNKLPEALNQEIEASSQDLSMPQYPDTAPIEGEYLGQQTRITQQRPALDRPDIDGQLGDPELEKPYLRLDDGRFIDNKGNILDDVPPDQVQKPDHPERTRLSDRKRYKALPAPQKQPEIVQGPQEALNDESVESGESVDPRRKIARVSLEDLGLSDEIPQFKSGANKDGVVDQLQGEYDETGMAPIQVWVRKDGRKEIITGRHRTDLARRSGKTDIPAQLHYEKDGFTAEHGKALDAILNIRDNQGSVKDYVRFFENARVTRAEADRLGITARQLGRRAYTIAEEGSPSLITALHNDQIKEEAAEAIARVAPKNEALQSVGLKALQEGKPNYVAINMIRAVQSMQGESDSMNQDGDLFGFDDSAMKQAEAMAKIAASKQRQIKERISAVKGAANKPEVARTEGVDVRDPESLKARIAELTKQAERYEEWHKHSDILTEIRNEVAPEQAVEPEPTRQEAPHESAQQEDAFSLEMQTEESLKAEQAEIDRKNREEKEAERKAEEKARIDREVSEFGLTGSDSVVDRSAAIGQTSAFVEQSLESQMEPRTDVETGHAESEKSSIASPPIGGRISNEEVIQEFKEIAASRYKGLSNVQKDVIRKYERTGEFDLDEAVNVIDAYKQAKEKRDSEFESHDKSVKDKMDRLYGRKSINELEAEYERLGGAIASLQTEGEITDGRRSTRKAVSNEAARAYASDKLALERYIKERKQEAEQAPLSLAVGDTVTPNIDVDYLTKGQSYQVERIEKNGTVHFKSDSGKTSVSGAVLKGAAKNKGLKLVKSEKASEQEVSAEQYRSLNSMKQGDLFKPSKSFNGIKADAPYFIYDDGDIVSFYNDTLSTTLVTIKLDKDIVNKAFQNGLFFTQAEMEPITEAMIQAEERDYARRARAGIRQEERNSVREGGNSYTDTKGETFAERLDNWKPSKHHSTARVLALRTQIVSLYRETEQAYEDGRLDDAEAYDAELDALLSDLDDRLESLDESDTQSYGYTDDIDTEPSLEEQLARAYGEYISGETYSSQTSEEFAGFVRGLINDFGGNAERATEKQLIAAAESAYSAKRHYVEVYRKARAEQKSQIKEPTGKSNERATGSLQSQKSTDSNIQNRDDDLFAAANLSAEQRKQSLIDTYYTTVKSRQVGTIKVGVERVLTPEEAAHIVAPYRKDAQETMLAIVTNNDGKVIEVIRHTKGLKDSSSVDPATLVGAILSVKGAKGVWFAHNHPSGRMVASESDIGITVKLDDLLHGTSVYYHGHVILGRGADAVYFKRGYDEKPIRITPALRNRAIPITERMLIKRTSENAISSPDSAREIIRRAKSPQAIILLNTQNQPVATLSVDSKALSQLRNTGQAERLLKAIDKANASAVILKDFAHTTESREAFTNVARFFNATKINLLDYFYADDIYQRPISGAQNRDGIVTSGYDVYYKLDSKHGTPPSRLAALAYIKRITKKWKTDGGIHLADTVKDLPEKIQTLMGVHGVKAKKAKGIFDRETGEIYILRNNLNGLEDLEATVFHEAYGHKGMDLLFKEDLGPALQHIYSLLGQTEFDRLAAKHGLKVPEYVAIHKTREFYAQREMPGELTEMMMDELLAHIAESNKPSIKRAVKEFWGAVRAWLAEKGFIKLSKWGEADLLNLLKEARKEMVNAEGSRRNSEKSIRFNINKSGDKKHYKLHRTEIDGNPTYISDNASITLINRHDTVESDFDDKSRLPHGHVDHVIEGAEVWDAIATVFDGDKEKIGGSLTVQVLNNRIVAIHDIKVQNKSKGHGEQIVASILASNPDGVKIIEAIPNAKPFWDKMGTGGFYDLYNNSEISWADYERARAKRDQQRSAEGIRSRDIRAELSGNDAKGSAREGVNRKDPTSAEEDAALKELQGWLDQNDAPRFSLASGKGLDDILTKSATTAWDRALDFLTGNKLFTSAKESALGLLTLRQLGDIGKKYLPQIKSYVDIVHKMLTDRNVMAEKAADYVDKWLEWAQKNRAEADKLASVMHDATLAGVDPSERYVSLDTNIDKQIRILEEQARGLSGDGTSKFVKQINELKKKKLAEPARHKKYLSLKPRFDAMSEEAKEYYRKARDQYDATQDAFHNILERKIEKAGMDGRTKKALLSKLRLERESQKLEIYFPLARFGNYFVDAVDPHGERVYLMFESEREQKRAAENMRKEGFTISNLGRTLDQRFDDGANLSFVNELLENLEGVSVNDKKSAEISDAIYQTYLQHLPDRSIRKQYIHRKGVAGFSKDAIRAFADKQMKSAYQLARLKHSDDLSMLMDEMKGTAKSGNESARLYNEMTKRHEWVMNPTNSVVSQKLTGLGFTWMLGVSPAAAAVNLTQTPVIAGPVLGSRYGYTNAFSEMLKASRLFSIKTGSMKDKLDNDQERAAFQHWHEMGLLDATRAHDLAGLAEQGGYNYSSTEHKWMGRISFLFHRAEQFNREVTALAAYRLAMKKHGDYTKAVNEAAELTWDSHYDYTNVNRARFMQSDFMKVATQFKQYSQNTTYYLFRNAYNMMKGATKEEKRIARSQLLGTLAITATIGGISALPLGLLFGLASFVFDDEDDPFDARTETHAYLAQTLGKDLADYIIYGAGGAGVSGRVSLDGMWLRDPNRDLEGQDLWSFYAQQAVGPVLGGIAPSMFEGVRKLNNGEYQRGFENMTPKFVKDLSKAERFWADGATTLKGDPLKEADDFSVIELALQAMGLSDSDVSKQYAENSSIKNYESQILDRRRRLMNRYYMAWKDGDTEEKQEVLKAIQKFNARWPQIRLSQKSLRQSIKAKQRYRQQAKDGAIFNRKLSQELERLDWTG